MTSSGADVKKEQSVKKRKSDCAVAITATVTTLCSDNDQKRQRQLVETTSSLLFLLRAAAEPFDDTTVTALVRLEKQIRAALANHSPRIFWVSEEVDAGFANVIGWVQTPDTHERETWIATIIPKGGDLIKGRDGLFAYGTCAEHEFKTKQWYGVLPRGGDGQPKAMLVKRLKTLDRLKESIKRLSLDDLEAVFDDVHVAATSMLSSLRCFQLPIPLKPSHSSDVS